MRFRRLPITSRGLVCRAIRPCRAGVSFSVGGFVYNGRLVFGIFWYDYKAPLGIMLVYFEHDWVLVNLAPRRRIRFGVYRWSGSAIFLGKRDSLFLDSDWRREVLLGRRRGCKVDGSGDVAMGGDWRRIGCRTSIAWDGRSV